MKQSHRVRRQPLPGWAKVLLVLTLLVVLSLATVTLFGMAATAQWNRYAATLRAAGTPIGLEVITTTAYGSDGGETAHCIL